jgi:hypothetical protein
MKSADADFIRKRGYEGQERVCDSGPADHRALFVSGVSQAGQDSV